MVHKLGQIEAIGLVVIVILITVIGLFVAKFSLNSDSSDVDVDIRDNILANNILNAVLQLTKGNESMMDSITKCKERGNCEELSNEIKDIMERIGYKEDKFILTVESGKDKLFEIGKCEGDMFAASPYKIRRNMVTYTIKFMLCRK